MAWLTWWVLRERHARKTLKRELRGPHWRRPPRRRKLRRPAHWTHPKKEKREQLSQGDKPEPILLSQTLEKKQKGKRKKKKKRKVEADAAELILKKKKAKGAPSATLGRAPDEELLPVPEMPPGAAPVAMEQRPSLDEQLEAHLLGTDPPATVAWQSQTAFSSTASESLRHGRFLGQTQKIHSSGWSVTGSGDHSCSEVA